MPNKPLLTDRELIERIIDKLNKLDDRLDSVDKTLVKQEANLAEHMRRTDLNEKAIAHMRDTLAPIKSHVDMMKGAGKLLALSGVVVSIISGIAKFFGLI